MDNIIKTEKINYLVIALLVITAKLTLMFFPTDHPMAQQDLLGWVSIGGILTLGFVALHFSKKAGFYNKRDKASFKKGIITSMALGLATGVLIIGISLYLKFPNIHIPLPYAIPVYFIAGSLLEFELHLIPLVLVTWLLSYVFFKTNFNNKIFWLVAFLMCIYEPFIQVNAMTSMGLITELWVQLFQFVFIFLTNLIPLVLFKKYGFLPFILYRFTDYAVWHIVWPLIFFPN